MLNVPNATLLLMAVALQQESTRGQLVIIAVINALVWVGAFLLILWLLNRNAESVEHRISQLESSVPEDGSPLTK